MKDINTYLFDFDGTLVNSQRSLTRVFQIAYKEVGVNITHEDTLYLMRVRLQRGYRKFKAPVNKESIHIFANAIIRELNDPETLHLTEIFEDTKETLDNLYRQGKTLGIVTSNSKQHVLDVLAFLDINANMFSVIVGNKEVKHHKPHPDPINTACSLLGVDKNSVAYVGDGLDDMRSAKRAGVTRILLDRYNEYDNQKRVKVIKSLRELL